MREILFRGKRTDTGEWIEGYFCKTRESNTCYIAKSEGGDNCNEYFVDYEVTPETVGQYTGLTDCNGKKIFEGDIVKCRHYWQLSRYPHIDIDEETYFFEQKIRGAYGKQKTESSGFSNYNYFYYRNYAVEYYEKKGEYRVRNGSCFNSLTRNFIFVHDIEIIGNIHDNPELLERSENGT